MAQFDDGKDQDALRTIGEVAKATGIKAHVLRYWEQQFPMPLTRSGGRRYYRPEDIELIERIDRLVNREGYTLKGAKAALRETPDPQAAAQAPAAPTPAADHAELVGKLKAIRDDLKAALAA